MKRNRTIIDNIIKKNKLMPLKSIKSELKVEKNSSLIRLLMEYLLSIVNEIDYSTDINDCIDSMRALNYIKPETEEEFRFIEKYVKELKEIICQKSELFKDNETLSRLLELLEERLGSFLIETRFEMIDKKETIKAFPSVNDKKLKSILCDYIFKYKDYGHLNLLISLYPNACNIRSNNKTIVIQILKNYLIKPQEREFLAKVITLFISNPNFQITEEERKEIATLCDQYSSWLKVNDLIFIKEVITTLGIRQEIDMNQKLDVLRVRFGIQNLMPENVRLSHEHFPVNMTDRVTLTIDCADTLIRDDAFSIERKPDGTFELGLYITDVSSIKNGSPLDVYAYNHFSTIYTRDSWIPMLPEPLIYEFSLDIGLRRAIAYTFRFTPQLELIDCEIVPAIIKVRKNLTYGESGELLKEENELYDFLKNALDLSDVIGDSLGTIDRYHHIKEIVRELGGNISEIPDKYLDTPGNRIISTFAVFLNNYLATLFDKSGLPFIYRVNDFESTANIQIQLAQYRRDKVICEMLRSLQTLYRTSTFSSVNTGHKGLGLSAYTQATNPARLYPSLMIQRMIIDLFVLKMPVEEYVKKYKDVEGYAQEFATLQERNCRFTAEYNKLCRHLTLDKK